MSLNTHLPGRLRNTPLPRSHGLLPLHEAVVNSIHAILEVSSDPAYGCITINILRSRQPSLPFDDSRSKRGAPPQDDIIGFEIVDNGVGFNGKNMASFETLDSDYKAHLGCRGVGRLMWLKAFDAVQVSSTFKDDDEVMKRRSFVFSASHGAADIKLVSVAAETPLATKVCLSGFSKPYRQRSAKTAKSIANGIFEHCLWYFVREGGAPKIFVRDVDEVINLDDVYHEYMFSSSKKETVVIKEQVFEFTHLQLKTGVKPQPFIAWCAANRVVNDESIAGRIPGLHGKIRGNDGDFIYACYVTSPFLDENVRPERIGFDIEDISDGMFGNIQVGLTEIREAVLGSASRYLESYLQENLKAGRERVNTFVSNRAPRYRPIMKRIDESKLSVDPEISDKDLDLLLHKQLAEVEGRMLSEGHDVMNFGLHETPAQYQQRLASYLEKADEIKKSDLANYVFHRKVILDILEKAVQRGPDGKYLKEDLIHELIMPMMKTSDDIHMDSCNLWLIDERLAFHDFLASDKPLSSFPIVTTSETKEPDICALNVFDEPLLVADGKVLPPASLTVIEIKRPMRNDAAQGEEKDPIEQALGYLHRVREGKAQTATGRPIPKSEDIPGFCYVLCDLTPSMLQRCRIHDLERTSDGMGYFGYKKSYNAYVEVISFDRLVKLAHQRNRAFFDKLGLPTN